MISPVNHRQPLSGNDCVSEQDNIWMQHAIQLAEEASAKNEVPVGAIVVLDNHVIGEGYNMPIMSHDPTAHAEIMAMRAAANHIGNYRLVNADLYVTLEPCMMCAGAMIHARIKRLYYGASDPKSGAVASMAQVLDKSFLNHRIQYSGGIMADHCGSILSKFFKDRR